MTVVDEATGRIANLHYVKNSEVTNLPVQNHVATTWMESITAATTVHSTLSANFNVTFLNIALYARALPAADAKVSDVGTAFF